jgi:polyisoprenoid-binding protein YceI
VAILCTLIALPLSAQALDLSADGPHTSASFSVKHFTVSTVSGNIAIKDAKLSTDANNVLTSAQATLDLTTIDTQYGQRDDELKSDKWFDVVKYPTMTFKSTKITGDKIAMTIVGDLAFHGVTNPVTLAAKYAGSTDLHGKTYVRYSATTTIDRTQWSLGNVPPAIVGTDVTVNLELEAVLP